MNNHVYRLVHNLSAFQLAQCLTLSAEAAVKDGCIKPEEMAEYRRGKEEAKRRAAADKALGG